MRPAAPSPRRPALLSAASPARIEVSCRVWSRRLPAHGGATTRIGLPALISGGSAFAAPLSAGMLLGNLLQESVHHRLHDTQPLGDWLEAKRRLHGFHHFRDERRGYGTLTDFWDRIFGTLPPRA